MAFAKDASDRYLLSSMEVPQPNFYGIDGQIESMEATTEQEKKEKEAALEQLNAIMGGIEQ